MGETHEIPPPAEALLAIDHLGLWEVLFLKDVIAYKLPMRMQASLVRLSEILRKKKRMQRWEGHSSWGAGGIGGDYDQKNIVYLYEIVKK